MEKIIVIAVLLVLVGSIVRYLLREKKRGKACTGCPCSGHCGHCCGK